MVGTVDLHWEQEGAFPLAHALIYTPPEVLGRRLGAINVTLYTTNVPSARAMRKHKWPESLTVRHTRF